MDLKKTKKGVGMSPDSAIVDVWKRELGQLSSRNFAHRRAASEDLVLRLDILRKLDAHRGCVNTISFNGSGDILVSGSDDKRIVLWDWEAGQIKLSFHSGHSNNVFQAKFMPYTGDRSIVTCAADGQVRFAQISESGVDTKRLAEHQGRVHKLAIEPGSPYIFYTCGEDGMVQHIDLRTESATRLFTCKPVPSHNFFPTLQLNTIAIDPRNPNLFAIGGSDPFARLYDIRKYKWDGSSESGRPVDFFCPMHLTDGDVGITGLAFSDQRELLASYNDEFIYLFTKDLGLGPNPTFSPQLCDGSAAGDIIVGSGDVLDQSQIVFDGVNDAPQSYKGHRNMETVKGVGFFGPNCEYVVSGSDCGRIFIWNKKGGELVRVMEADKHIVNCVVSHTHAAVLASSGIEHDIKIWIPKAVDRAILPTNIEMDKVESSTRQRFAFFPFGGYYDDTGDDDDFICLDDDDDDDDDDGDDDNGDIDDNSGSGDDDDDDGDDDNGDIDDNSGSGDDDDNHDDYGDGDYENIDYTTENHDGHCGNEVATELLEEEEDNDGTDFTSVGDSDENNDCCSEARETDNNNESENDSDTGNVASDDDSFLDICYDSDFACSDNSSDD